MAGFLFYGGVYPPAESPDVAGAELGQLDAIGEDETSGLINPSPIPAPSALGSPAITFG